MSDKDDKMKSVGRGMADDLLGIGKPKSSGSGSVHRGAWSTPPRRMSEDPRWNDYADDPYDYGSTYGPAYDPPPIPRSLDRTGRTVDNYDWSKGDTLDMFAGGTETTGLSGVHEDEEGFVVVPQSTMDQMGDEIDKAVDRLLDRFLMTLTPTNMRRLKAEVRARFDIHLLNMLYVDPKTGMLKEIDPQGTLIEEDREFYRGGK